MISFTVDKLLPLAAVIGLATIVSSQQPRIVNDILPEVKRVGMTARLDCTVARLSGYQVQWAFTSKDEPEIISIGTDIQIWNEVKGTRLYEVEQIPQEGDRVTFRLTISRLRPEYDGVYECSVIIPNVSPDQWERKTGIITVLQSPVIRPGSTDSVKLMEKGTDSSITCDAVGVPAPNITWVRSDGKLLPNGKAIFRGRTLPIASADVHFAGVYKCVADNNIKPPAISLTQVYVFQEPTVRVLQDSVGQLANGKLEAKLDCIVQGYPTPAVYWMVKDGPMKRVLTDSDKFDTTKQATDTQNLYNGEQWYTLTISFVQALDFRDYYCVGNNSKGEGIGKVTLFATTECQGPLCYSMSVGIGNGAASSFTLSTISAIVVFVLICLTHRLGLET